MSDTVARIGTPCSPNISHSAILAGVPVLAGQTQVLQTLLTDFGDGVPARDTPVRSPFTSAMKPACQYGKTPRRAPASPFCLCRWRR